MATPIRIKVVRDEDGKLEPETEAEVVVGRRDLVGDSDYPYDDLLPTFKHDAEGHYVNSSGLPENEPGAGEWLIVVRKQGFSRVAQKLTFRDVAGVLRAAGGWNEPGVEKGVAATVSIVNFDEAKGKETAAKQSLVTIRLFPAQRYVGMGCRDNHGGTRFTLFAQGRRDFLYDTEVLNNGCIVTLFDCLENRIHTTVKGSKASPSHWFVVHSADPPQEKVTILDFYGFLNEVGGAEPKTVVEAGIFGHAWHQGPIVQDTFDQSNDLDKRDPDDADGRPKDWYPNGAVATDFPKLVEALAADARVVVWGCSHMINVVAEAAECNRRVDSGTPRDQFFSVVLTDGGRLNTTLDYAKRGIAQNIVSQRKGRFPEQGSASGQCTYGGVLARALASAAPVFVAMPGAGANFGRIKGPRRKDRPQVSHITMHVVNDGENTQLKRFYEREYGALFERDAVGYQNYTKFLAVSLPDPGYSTLRFARYFWPDFGSEFLRLPSGLEIVRKKNTGSFERPVALSRDGETGHLYLAKRAVASAVQIRGPLTLVALKPDTQQDLGFFVTDTGKTLLFERKTGTNDFVVPSVMPRLFDTVMDFDPRYEVIPGDPGQPLAGNLIQQVTPQWFW